MLLITRPLGAEKPIIGPSLAASFLGPLRGGGAPPLASTPLLSKTNLTRLRAR